MKLTFVILSIDTEAKQIAQPEALQTGRQQQAKIVPIKNNSKENKKSRNPQKNQVQRPSSAGAEVLTSKTK
jgi:hypothetical protein